MTRLEAVNFILAQNGLNPVAAVETSAPSVAGNAERCLLEAERTVQQRGWECNRRNDVEVALNGSDQAATPSGLLWLQPLDGKRYADIQDSGTSYLYDLDENTNVLTSAPRINYVVQLAWLSTPVVLQRYIAAVASRMYHERWGNRDPYRMQTLMADEAESNASAMRADSRGGAVNLFDTQEAYTFRGGRNRGAPGGTY